MEVIVILEAPLEKKLLKPLSNRNEDNKSSTMKEMKRVSPYFFESLCT
jgi:hypothetical protein